MTVVTVTWIKLSMEYSRFEFLGKLALPLLKMENGRKRWHALKDKKMRLRAKGSNATANPQGGAPFSRKKT